MSLAKAGSVLGVDVGFSPVRRSSAVCRLGWAVPVLDDAGAVSLRP